MPHRDHDMWWGRRPDMEYQLGVIWPLTPFERKNGATRLWAGSQHWLDGVAVEELDAQVAEMDLGSALIFLGSVLHAAGANLTTTPRSAIMVAYCLGWLKPFENQWLVYPPHVARNFSPEIARLIGYQLHRPNLGNYEGQCPSILLNDVVPDHLGFVDALREI